MAYLTNYYKNLCEQLKYKVNTLQTLLEYEDNRFGCPDGNCDPIPVGDSDAILSRKEFQTQSPPPPPTGGPWITPQNYQQIIMMLLGWLGNPPSWWNVNYWVVNPGQTPPLQASWGNFVNELIAAVERAGCQGGGCNPNQNLGPPGPERYFALIEKFRQSTAAVDGQPRPWPLNYQARYHPVEGSNVQVAMRDWDPIQQYDFGF